MAMKTRDQTAGFGGLTTGSLGRDPSNPTLNAVLRFVLVLTSLLLLPKPLWADPSGSRQGTEAKFRNWLEREVWPDARAQGVSRAVFDQA